MASAVVEILPPEQVERDENGRFKEGSRANPNGRPAGQPVGFTRMMRDAIQESFAIVGGTDYLVMLAYWKPELYAALIGRAMPIKVVGDDDAGIEVVRRVERTFID